ncbi:hypothetical protein U0070_010093 [Myodes glareolus]|uniref:Uncharacterized protein n=1 Tax=Myodes glareolus TaxID=447135 RepID=A0AAW0I309_MYOGA
MDPWSGVTWKHEDFAKSSFFLETLSFWQPLNCVPAEPGDLWVHSHLDGPLGTLGSFIERVDKPPKLFGSRWDAAVSRGPASKPATPKSIGRESSSAPGGLQVAPSPRQHKFCESKGHDTLMLCEHPVLPNGTNYRGQLEWAGRYDLKQCICLPQSREGPGTAARTVDSTQCL